MTRYGSCACCQRRFRSIATRELAEKRAAVLADLKLSRTLSQPIVFEGEYCQEVKDDIIRWHRDRFPVIVDGGEESRQERHRQSSASYKQHGVA